MKRTITIDLEFEQYRTLVETMNEAEDLCRLDGTKVPDHMHRLLKTLLIAGLKAGWAHLPECFTGDKELMDAAAEAKALRNFDVNNDPDPTTRH